jgi:hypothetical protein
MSRATSIEKQWLGDIVIRESGSISALVDAAIENDISITGRIEAGTDISITGIANERVADYFRSRNICPATVVDQEASDGIGYMAVGSTFIVS